MPASTTCIIDTGNSIVKIWKSELNIILKLTPCPSWNSNFPGPKLAPSTLRVPLTPTKISECAQVIMLCLYCSHFLLYHNYIYQNLSKFSILTQLCLWSQEGEFFVILYELVSLSWHNITMQNCQNYHFWLTQEPSQCFLTHKFLYFSFPAVKISSASHMAKRTQCCSEGT